jgi:hypothetical protein
MKTYISTALLLAALAWLPARGQTATPATNLPQLTLSPDPTGNPASTPLLTTPPPSTPAPTTPPRTVRVPAAPADAFAAAVTAYGKNDFVLARELFAGAEKKATSPALEFNLGNACYQTTEYGPAILHYLRALSLNPRDPDARQNLALARKGANITAPDETRLAHYAGFFTRNTWTWITSLCGWLAVYLAFLPRLYRWRGVLPWLLCLAFLAAAIGGGVGLWGAQQHAHDGVVLHADTTVNISPTPNSQSLGMLQPGEMAQMVEQHGDYFKIRTAAGLIGWVSAANYSPVWN